MWSNVLVDPRWTTLQITVVGLLYFKSFIVTALRAESSQISISPLIKPNMGRCGLIFAIKMSNYVISRIQAVHVLSGISHQTAMIERDWLWRMTPSDLQESLEDILTFSFFFPPNAMLIFFSPLILHQMNPSKSGENVQHELISSLVPYGRTIWICSARTWQHGAQAVNMSDSHFSSSRFSFGSLLTNSCFFPGKHIPSFSQKNSPWIFFVPFSKGFLSCRGASFSQTIEMCTGNIVACHHLVASKDNNKNSWGSINYFEVSFQIINMLIFCWLRNLALFS